MSDRWNEIDDVELLQMESEMKQDLDDLRKAATVYADRAWQRSAAVAPGRSSVSFRTAARHGWLTWAAASAVAATLAVGGVRLAQREAPQEEDAITTSAPSAATTRPVSDEALLEQIQNDLSTGVPSAMEPLQTSAPHDMHEPVQHD